MREFVELLKRLFTKIPIIGVLANLQFNAILEALIELIITLLFSTLPIWFYALVDSIGNFYKIPIDTRSASLFYCTYKSSLVKTVSNGELLMYAAATLGPTLYLGLSYFGKKNKPFPWIRPQLVLSILITAFSTCMFITSRQLGYANDVSFVSLSALLYFLSLILLFPAMAYDQEIKLANILKMQQSSEDEFRDGYRRRKQ
jgi:hypothetical protein